MDFRRSKTYNNLLSAFDGELKASSKYKIYSIKAREDGYEQIGNIFDETAWNEQEHAKIWLKCLKCGEVPSTYENLKEAAAREHYIASKMYRNYANVARDEGYLEIAELFNGVAKIEGNHENQFQKLSKNIKKDTVFCKSTKVTWICTNCGHMEYCDCAPHKCPICGYPHSYFEIREDNY
ncbi:rubrerythrin [Mobilisporobacter senegalensis]|uniref:Rubrerythrin n=1 Tax=Mobilisporobacter senegalensis TaxID=1329262 RepID=A0A3N1XKJ2_9FIRM|nr:ferritin family protein [Mobilisporobacter senegalensis]ROR27196.1 rubrerythrin [Mobilisporobacter senegalensis]